MNTELFKELTIAISKIDHKLELLQNKASNDENLVNKKRALLKQYFELKYNWICLQYTTVNDFRYLIFFFK